MQKKLKYVKGLLAALLMLGVQPVWAAGPPAPSMFSNPMAVTLIIFMLLLLVIIGVLASMVIGTAELKMKQKKISQGALASIAFLFLMLSAPALFAQDATAAADAAPQTKNIAGMAPTTFYIMIAVLFIELLVIIGLLLSVKSLLRKEKNRVLAAAGEGYAAGSAEAVAAEKDKLTWWDKFNSLRPSSEEADLDLGHDYDGIRELNNRLPGWWLYGFYFTIIFAAIYLWRYHVSHTAPLSAEEYTTSVAKAEAKVQEYLKKKGDAIDETTVTLLTSAEDIAAGKETFTSKCVACHGPAGGGVVGPNLTDDYWIYGGSVQSIFKTIKYGAPSTKGMVSWKELLTSKQIAQVTSFIKSLKGTNPPGGKTKEGALYTENTSSVTITDSLKAAVDTLKK